MSDDESSAGGFSSDDDSFFAEPAIKVKATKKSAPPKRTAPTKKAPTKKALTKKAAIKKRPAPGTDDESDRGNLSNTPPSKKTKKAPAKKAKAAGKPLGDTDMVLDNDVGAEQPDRIEPEVNSELSTVPATTKSTTQTYQKLTQLEHILKRPDTYVGSIEHTEKAMWVYDSESGMMAWKTITYVPGLYKIFDEILVNAADNKTNDPSMDTLKVTFDREKNEVTVFNNGRGIPIEIHEKEGIYIPELIFGHLLTSSNYDDDEKKVTGGRNGYGAKLCNIFSTEFTLETADKKSRKKYKQTWTDNMGTCGKAKISANSKGEEYTKVTFKPDLTRFKLLEMDADHESIFKRRVYDLAGTVRGVKVFLNGERISKVKGFKQYCEMYVKALQEKNGEESTKMELIHATVGDHWEIAFAVSDGNFQQVSFVNNIATTSGGTHVDNIASQLCTKLDTIVAKKNKSGAKVKPGQMRNHFFLFVNSQVVNPAFTSQTKEQLTTKSKDLAAPPIPEEFIKKIIKTELISNILAFANVKADKALKKSDGSRRSRIHNPNLTDANKAGTKDGHQCTLILTEGLSASGLALGGISAINGRDRYGVFPLRGKVLNVRDASHDQIMKNVEIQNLKQILGLQHKKNYESTKDLRYGHIMIMTDQDHDGSHIKGLLINFFETQFPSLLKIQNFLIEFITPIVKVYKGNPKKPSKEVAFFTMPEYEYWKENNTESGWKHKYYKGLGTSDPNEDAKIYFADLDKHMKFFHTMEDEGKKLIELAFSKTKADERKEWLRQYQPGTYLDHSIERISYPDFINKELILFSIADCARSIPSVVDGLKPGQRKILFSAFKRNLKNEIKVAQLAGYVSEHTGYQHGEASLQGTIVGMGQVYAGANNVNLLEPSGNFGSRLQGGKDAASARYIFTLLSPFTRKVIPVEDDRLLAYNDDDGQKIEPHWYIPVLPMILINGAEGIGTGWSSNIPSYNPEDVVANLRRLMDGEEMEPMIPWYRGWTGTVERLSAQKFKFTGIIRQMNEIQVEVTELPVKMWTQNFKEKLEEIIKAEKTPSFIKDYVDYNSPSKVHFIITMESEKHMQDALTEGLENKFKLTTTASTTNLVAFDPEGRITRYSTVEDIMKEFFFVRLKYYQLRKARLLVDLNSQLQKLSNQARFIQMIIKKELIVGGRKRADIISQLQKHKFATFSKKKEAEMAGELEPTLEENSDLPNAVNDGSDNVGDGYNYLLGMAIWTLTEEKAQKLLKDVADKEEEVDILTRKSPKDLWTHDLDQFLAQWQYQLEEDIRLQQTVVKKKGNKLIKGRVKKNTYDDESDYESPVAKKRRAPAKKQTTLPFAAEPPPEKKPTARAAAKKKPIIDEEDDRIDEKDFDLIKTVGSKAAPKSKIPENSLKALKVENSDEDFDMLAELSNEPKVGRPLENGDSFITAEEEPTPKKSTKPIDLSEDEDSEMEKPKKVLVKKATTKAPPKAKLKTKLAPKAKVSTKPASNSIADESSIYDFDDEENPPIKRSIVGKRVAAKKTPILDDSENNSEEDDSLGDMSAMVKGIGDESTVSTRPLFTESRKTSGPSGKPVVAKKGVASKFVDLNDSMSESDNMDIDDDSTKPAYKAAPQKAIPKKAAAKRDVKKAPVKLATKGRRKKPTVSTVEEDVDGMVNKLLDSDGESDVPAPKVKATAKPRVIPAAMPKPKEIETEIPSALASRPARGSRAAAAKKPTYTVDISESEDDAQDEDDSEDYDEDDD